MPITEYSAIYKLYRNDFVDWMWLQLDTMIQQPENPDFCQEKIII